MAEEREYKPHIDRVIAGWSGERSGGQQAPRQEVPVERAAGRELFGPARKVIEGVVPAPTEKPRVARPRPNYRLPE